MSRDTKESNDLGLIEFSPETAEMIVCKQLVDPASMDYVNFISEHFKKDWLGGGGRARKDVYTLASAYWKKYEKIPSSDTMQALFKSKKFDPVDENDDRRQEVADEYDRIMSFDTSKFDKEMMTETIKKYIKSKAIYFAVFDNADKILSKGEVGGLLEQFEGIVKLDLATDLGIEYFENFSNHCNELQKRNTCTPFGFPELDRVTAGGIPNDDTCLIIIMGSPGLGKSQFMMNIAANWVKMNKKVLMISLEMSEMMYSKRMDGIFTDLNINRLHENIETLQHRVNGMKAGLPKAMLRIKEFPTGTFTPAMLKQYLKKLEDDKNFVPDIVFVDYLNIMKPNGNNSALSLYEKCARISEELRAISCERKIPIVSAVQQNRSNGMYSGENVELSDVGESAGISATADALFALFRLDGDFEADQINLKILKNRLGGNVGTKMRFHTDRESLKISSMEKEAAINAEMLDGADIVKEDESKDKGSGDKSPLEEI